MPLDLTAAILVPARHVEASLGLWLAALPFKSSPLKLQCDLVEQLREVIVAPFGQLFLLSRKFAVCQRNTAFAPVAPKKETVIFLFDDDFLISQGYAVVGDCDDGLCGTYLADGWLD